MEKLISVIIPAHNAGTTIEKCLAAALSSRYSNFEVIVVDDFSTDDSVEVIKKFPCRLIQLNKHSGASKARNTGAQFSMGEILFFIDADCLLLKDTLAHVNSALEKYNSDNVIIGGTYTHLSYDNNFFSDFQSVFVNYSETKKDVPDYIATHAMVISPDTFRKSGGFSEDFLPILEDVEFSHRLRRAGYKLVMDPGIVVQHIFNFNLTKSIKNVFKKSLFWTMYSLKNMDIFKDSGTASAEFKVNAASCFLILLLTSLLLASGSSAILIFILFIFAFNMAVNRQFLKALYNAKGLSFATAAAFYYLTIYPIAAGTGAFAGFTRYLMTFAVKRHG